jgi:uncharacterized RDD family membrane protein YckC
MSDVSQGPGWWQASDGKWYPPEQAPGAQPAAPTGPPAFGAPPAYGAPAYGAPAYGAPSGMPGGAPEYADWGTRVASYAIDFIALSVIANIVSAGSDVLGTLLSLLAFAFGIYNAWLNGSTGQSVGKKIMGTKVVGEATGQPIGGGLGIVRYLAHIVDAIICFIGFLFPLWDAKKQTLADKIMKTVVITGVPKVPFAEAIKPG